MCSSRKIPEIPRGRGVLKVKILEAKYEAKLEFPGGGGGWGVQNKKPSVGEYGYFLELHNNFITIHMYSKEGRDKVILGPQAAYTCKHRTNTYTKRGTCVPYVNYMLISSLIGSMIHYKMGQVTIWHLKS